MHITGIQVGDVVMEPPSQFSLLIYMLEREGVSVSVH